MRRTNSFSNWEALHNVWTAAEVIKAAGYPLEEHTVITADGYKLRMERLPRTGAPLGMHVSTILLPDIWCISSRPLFSP